ncbi:MAG: STAS domain-containing protein [Planctomycetes bacterium]|nr:STAS domain-containing protein [Planctomycetota bacterium]
MPIFSTFSDDGTLTLHIAGRFDFRSREAFLRSYEECEREPSAFLVDLRDAEYIDSSALGMLLLLRDFAASKGARVTLERPRPLVARTLAASDFDHWFTVA